MVTGWGEGRKIPVGEERHTGNKGTEGKQLDKVSVKSNMVARGFDDDRGGKNMW